MELLGKVMVTAPGLSFLPSTYVPLVLSRSVMYNTSPFFSKRACTPDTVTKYYSTTQVSWRRVSRSECIVITFRSFTRLPVATGIAMSTFAGIRPTVATSCNWHKVRSNANNKAKLKMWEFQRTQRKNLTDSNTKPSGRGMAASR